MEVGKSVRKFFVSSSNSDQAILLKRTEVEQCRKLANKEICTETKERECEQLR